MLSEFGLAEHSEVNLVIPEGLAVKLTLVASALKQNIAVCLVARIEAGSDLSQELYLLFV